MSRCETPTDRLSLYVDGQLDRETAALVRAHLASCASCRAVLDDIVRLQASARGLGALTPPAHLWPRIAARLDGQAHTSSSTYAARPPSGRWHSMAVAATLAVVTLAGYLVVRLHSPIAPANASDVTGTVEAMTREVELAVVRYERAIGELEAAAKDNPYDIEPDVADGIHTSLTALDRAIAESRQALAADPMSEPARISLFESLQDKVDLLQTSVWLTNDIHTAEADDAGTGQSRRAS